MTRTSSRTTALAVGALFAAASLAACGSSGGTDAGGTPSATTSASAKATSSAKATGSAKTSGSAKATASAPAVDKDISVTLTGSKVSPPPGKVKVNKGDTVRITVTRDTDGEIHVHGYDKQIDAKAGVPASVTFVADTPGIFEVEAHDPDRLLFQLQVS